MGPFFLATLYWVIGMGVVVSTAQANGGKRPGSDQPSPGVLRRVVRVHPFSDRFIELPSSSRGQERRAYGRNIYEALRAALDGDGRFIVMAPVTGDSGRSGVSSESQASSVAALSRVPADPIILPLNPEVAVDIEGRVTELSFQTGERAQRVAYGFRPGFENEFNNGTPTQTLNEFSFNENDNDGPWFGSTFADTGDLHFGMDLGNQLNFDVLWLGAALKWASYQSRMGMELTFRHVFEGVPQLKTITAQGKGFYFNLAAQYQGLTAQIVFAHRTAMLDAFNRTVQGLVAALKEEIAKKPVIAMLGGPGPRGELFVTVGALNYNAGVGQRFYSRSAWERSEVSPVFTIDRVYQTISSVRVSGGVVPRIGDRLVSLGSGENPPPLLPSGVATSALSSLGGTPESVVANLASQNLNLPAALRPFEESAVVRFFKGLVELVTLPFRIARFLQYDQTFSGGEMWQADLARAQRIGNQFWSMRTIGAPEAWGETMGSNSIVVAVLDSGVDYNHQDLRRNIYWDGRRQSPGYDFYSDDPRPFDDHAHGTAVAGAIAGGGWQIMGAAPRATILPVKVFSPLGETSSAALLAGFEYAIAQGAKIIVCGWATPRYSQALRQAVRLAQDRGVLVVAAAGDQGLDLSRQPHYPASLASEFDNVLTVAGYGYQGGLTRQSGVLGLSSNYGGPTALAAPSGQILSASPRNGYNETSYTGVAAGLVAGGAALLWASCPQASYEVIKESLLEGALPLLSLGNEVLENKGLFIPHALRALKIRCNESVPHVKL